MRILFYSPHPHLGLYDKAGYATHMRKVIEAFRKQGHEVETLIMGGENKPSENSIQVSTSGKKAILKKLIPALLWETLKDRGLRKFDGHAKSLLLQKIKSFQPEMVYERINYLQTSGVEACNESGVKHVAEINSPYTEERVFLQGKTMMMKEANVREKRIFELSDKVVVVSTALKNYFINRYSFAKDKILVVPNAVDPDGVKIDEEKFENIKNELSHFEGKTIIGFVGSIAPWHGIQRLLEAARDLKQKRNDLAYLIVGGGEQLEKFKTMANEFGISEIVHWTGSVPSSDVYAYISLMNITVMPDSNWYGSPIKIFEYGILKKPVIAPDYVPLQDVIENQKDGILIGKGSLALPDAIQKLVDAPEFQYTLGESLYKKIISTFTWSKVANTIVTAIEKK